MPSLVADFIINPVIRQARRLSERATNRDQIQVQPQSRQSQDPPIIDPNCAQPSTPQPTTTATTRAPSSADIVIAEENEEEHGDTVGDLPSFRHPSDSDAPNGLSSSPSQQQTRDQPLGSAPTLATMAANVPKDPRHSLPEDDGMGSLRKRLITIQAQTISPEDKARLMHETLMENYRLSQTALGIAPRAHAAAPRAPVTAGEAWERAVPAGALEALKFWQSSANDAASPDSFLLSPDDIKPTFVPAKQPKGGLPPNDDDTAAANTPESARPLGCQHYRRNVKLQCSTCAKWYTCRFCHDAAENHELIRKDTKNMLCMLCACPQKAAESCVNCGVPAARYFCGICKLWDDHPNKNIYHCNDCGICRRGQGLGKDFFHCKKCCACISISIKDTHKCIERSTDCDCPICGEYMFTSPKPVVFMQCGHSIHGRCYEEHMRRSYKCPICNKSLLNMETQFRQLELEILAQPMPQEFRDTKAVVLCNDCSGKSTVPYHWLGLKCAICSSYNTVELRMSAPRQWSTNPDASPPLSPPTGPVAPVEMQGTAGTPAVPIARHRRFSSLAVPQGPGGGGAHRGPLDDRMARSSSPMRHRPPPGVVAGVIPDGFGPQIEEAEDSDEDILSFWNSRTDESEEESASDEGDMMTESEEEDDDNDIMLIGHR
ncbi:CHY zinc finger protein [Plectosphaerella plurivora]|uniref:CHY zinc finger protein n=1 Tax=Plectosphaerella plurivora TaxID=936078 RepID=A0A9P9A608_9PEZI|nr:CHY zinc finger protein [Plectosphaerella plurivora]